MLFLWKFFFPFCGIVFLHQKAKFRLVTMFCLCKYDEGGREGKDCIREMQRESSVGVMWVQERWWEDGLMIKASLRQNSLSACVIEDTHAILRL